MREENFNGKLFDLRSKNVDELSIDNLRFGRITRDSMKYAMDEVKNYGVSIDDNYYTVYLAEEVNELIEFGKMLHKREAISKVVS